MTMQTIKHSTAQSTSQTKGADADFRIVRFSGRMMAEVQKPYKHYEELRKEQFEQFIYQTQGYVSRTQMNNLYAHARHTAKDLSQNDRFVVFGDAVWDTEELTMRSDIESADCVWRSPYASMVVANGAPVPFIMNLVGGDQGLYDDIMQSLAPLVMATKPDGVIWWVGEDSKGMSMLLEAAHLLFPRQLSSISLKRLIGGRETRLLNETFGNVVKEISDGRVEDAGLYKTIAKHEDFTVHKYHSQGGLKISGNMHHIFSANQAPTFTRKDYSTQWRTFVVTFAGLGSEGQKLTPEMLGQLIAEMCHYANRIRLQGYRYEWSATTTAAMVRSNTSRNNQP